MDKVNEKTVTFPSIGKVKFLKKKGLRRVSITLKPFKGVVVTVPFSVSYETAENFVLQKVEWIEAALVKMEKLESRKSTFTEDHSFKTRHRTLLFERHPAEKQKIVAKILEKEIRISVPANVELDSNPVQNMVVKAIEQAWSIEAKQILPQRMDLLASKFGFKYSGITIKRIKSRWGSCSSVNNINLSIYLMNLPEHLVDYVILHELCHTVEKNHGPKFWALLDKVSEGNAKAYAKEMRGYSTRYF